MIETTRPVLAGHSATRPVPAGHSATRPVPAGRPFGRLVLTCVTVLAFAGCGPSNHLASELTALEQAGLKPAGFVEADAAKMGAKACQTGTVNQLPAMLCEYDDAQAAAGAKGTVESWVGAALTGVVVNREQYVLALADHAQLDPNGKEISAVARAFRKQAAPGSAGAGAAGMTEAGVSTAAAAGASQSTAGEGQPAAPGQPASP